MEIHLKYGRWWVNQFRFRKREREIERIALLSGALTKEQADNIRFRLRYERGNPFPNIADVLAALIESGALREDAPKIIADAVSEEENFAGTILEAGLITVPQLDECLRFAYEKETTLRSALIATGHFGIIDRELERHLIEASFLSPEAAATARNDSQNNDRWLWQELEHYVARETLVSVLSLILGVPIVDIIQFPYENAALDAIPFEMADRLMVLPLSFEQDRLKVAVDNLYGLKNAL